MFHQNSSYRIRRIRLTSMSPNRNPYLQRYMNFVKGKLDNSFCRQGTHYGISKAMAMSGFMPASRIKPDAVRDKSGKIDESP